MNYAKAFAPGNVSLIFALAQKGSQKGSIGLGFTTKKGLVAKVSVANKFKVTWNGNKVSLPVLKTVIASLTESPVNISIKAHFPLGVGFGMSGASCLATAYAINKLLNLKKTKKELAMVAHKAEVHHLTGMGDVTNQYLGGMLLKTKPSFAFKATTLHPKKDTLYYATYSILETKKVLSNRHKINTVNRVGNKTTTKLHKKRGNISMEQLFDLSYDFAKTAKLIPITLNKKIDKIHNQNGHATMIMLGNSIISTKKFPGSKTLQLSRQAAKVIR